jgi:hypothetical protein
VIEASRDYTTVPDMEIADIRRRVRAAIDQAKRDAAARRERSAAAARAYEEFLIARAVPAFNLIASALAGEGHRFKVSTPPESVRLSSENASESYIELALDPTDDPPAVLIRSNVGRGRRAVTRERSVRTDIATLTEDDVVGFVLDEIGLFVER